jgi:hypothetical protein
MKYDLALENVRKTLLTVLLLIAWVPVSSAIMRQISVLPRCKRSLTHPGSEKQYLIVWNT